MKKPVSLLEEEAFNYSYGRYLPTSILVLFSLLACLGFYLGIHALKENMSLLFPAILCIVICVASFIPMELLQIDFKRREYRIGLKIFSYISGDWKPIGSIKYLSIVNVRKHIHLKSGQSKAAIKNELIEECQLRLFVSAGRNIVIDDYQKKSSAITIATPIAKGLGLEVLDATVRPPFFIDISQ